MARLWARLNSVTLRQADGVVTVTEGLADTLRPLLRHGTPLRVIPNGVNSPEVTESGAPSEWPYAVFIGNLATWQGIDLMLAATRHPAWPTELRLVVIGDGSQAERVASEAGLIVVPQGRLPRHEAMVWLEGAEFAFSLQDPDSPAAVGGYWPYKILEAAAYGVPTITSDARGLPEMATVLGSTIVCGYGDVAAVAEAAARLMGDRPLRERLRGRGDETSCLFSGPGRPACSSTLWTAANRNTSSAFVDG